MTSVGEVEPTPVERTTDRRDVRAFLESTLRSARERPLAIVMPAPVGHPMALLARLRRGDAFHLHDERRSITTLGSARLASLVGEGRFRDARRAYELDRDELRTVAHERVSDARPLWTMGFAFAAGRARDPWAPLGDGLLSLPRWSHRVENGSATLALVVDREEPVDAQLALAELDALWDALATRPSGFGAAPSVQVRHVDAERWATSLADVQARIARGDAQKIVVARRSTVLADRDLDPVRVTSALERPGATVFCVRRRGVCFVGATPERLFRVRGRHLLTEAVAGTASLERDPAGRRLFASAKDVHEHQLVVDGICAALSALRSDVSIGHRALRTIGAIAHLATPIDALLSTEVSAFEILEALHPTAAVGGTPRAEAVRWISDHEPDRGWYAGPIGWIDADGNAEVHVALRSALLVGARAYAYAGCGVVAGSDPAAEYAETALKLAPMLAALGAEP